MADKTIGSLPDAGTLDGADFLHIEQGGNSRRVTLDDLKTFINTDPTVVPSSEPWRGARVKRTADLAIVTSTVTAVTWQAADLDTDSIWSGGAPTRLTVPTGVTKVRLTGNARFETNTTGYRQAYLLKNGAIVAGAGMQTDNPVSIEHAINFTSAVLAVTAGDYFEMVVAHTRGSNLSLYGLTRQEYNWFQMEIVEG